MPNSFHRNLHGPNAKGSPAKVPGGGRQIGKGPEPQVKWGGVKGKTQPDRSRGITRVKDAHVKQGL